jgi:hypothetical protein
MIIGIIPNKNDGWILEANLKIFSKVCDKIIIGLDNSTDDSVSIIEKFSNAFVVENSNSDLVVNKPNRRQALLEKAREFDKNPVIIAIDADEIFSEEIFYKKNMDIIKNLDFENTVHVKFRELWFSPYLYRSEQQSCWSGRLMPCIWKDDGSNYPLSNWHEARVPINKKIKIIDLDLVHFARVQPIKYWSRIRYYIARDIYINKKNPIKTNFLYSITHSEKDMILSPIKKEWFPSFDNEFIFNLQKKDNYINWYNDEILQYLLNDKNFSLKLADIWDFNWVQYYEIRKNKIANQIILPQLTDRRSNLEKRISYKIKMNFSYPLYSVYFYIHLLKVFLIKVKLYNLIRGVYLKLKKYV